MATIRRVRTVFTGVAGSPYYHSMYWPASKSTEDCVTDTAAWADLMAGVMSDQVDYLTDGLVVNLDSATGEAIGAVAVDGIAGDGNVAGELLPPANQILIRLATGVYVGGRQIRGRCFVPAITVDTDVDGAVNPGVVSGLSDDVATYLGGLEDAPLVWSRKTGAAPPVAAGSVWGQFAVLRSRRD